MKNYTPEVNKKQHTKSYEENFKEVFYTELNKGSFEEIIKIGAQKILQIAM